MFFYRNVIIFHSCLLLSSVDRIEICDCVNINNSVIVSFRGVVMDSRDMAHYWLTDCFTHLRENITYYSMILFISFIF